VPEVPTLSEAGLDGYDITSWQALFAPGGTPKEIVARIHSEVAKALRSPRCKGKSRNSVRIRAA